MLQGSLLHFGNLIVTIHQCIFEHGHYPLHKKFWELFGQWAQTDRFSLNPLGRHFIDRKWAAVTHGYWTAVTQYRVAQSGGLALYSTIAQ